MKINTLPKYLTPTIVLFGALSTCAHSAVTMTIEDSVGGVKVSISGSISGAPTSSITNWKLSDSIRVIGSQAPTGNAVNGDVIHFSSGRFQAVEFFSYSTPGGGDFDNLVSLTTTEVSTLVGNIQGGRFGIINDSGIIVQRSGSDIISGSFVVGSQTVSSLGLVEGRSSWQMDNGDTLTLTVVPEPSTTALFATGALSLLLRRRRHSR